MRLTLIAIGRLKNGPERELASRYELRFSQIGRGVGLDPLKVIELPESPARRPEDRMADEGRAITAALPDRAFLIALDERGRGEDSDGFARLIETQRGSGRADLCFVIGGADGLDPAMRARADRVLSFGQLTIPHQLVRVLVLEQTYRAATILSGHPYHRI